jgi:hypothetical protein
MFSLKTIIAFAAIILIFHSVATINNLYWLMPWLDMPMHALGGIWAAMLFGYLNQKFFKLQNFRHFVLMTISFVAFVAVLWEFLEFFIDHLSLLKKFGSFQGDLNDTMSDLFLGLAGGIILILFDRIFRKNIL